MSTEDTVAILPKGNLRLPRLLQLFSWVLLGVLPWSRGSETRAIGFVGAYLYYKPNPHPRFVLLLSFDVSRQAVGEYRPLEEDDQTRVSKRLIQSGSRRKTWPDVNWYHRNLDNPFLSMATKQLCLFFSLNCYALIKRWCRNTNGPRCPLGVRYTVHRRINVWPHGPHHYSGSSAWRIRQVTRE